MSRSVNRSVFSSSRRALFASPWVLTAIGLSAGATSRKASAAYSPNPADFATSVVNYNITGETNPLYDSPAAVLGPPTITFNDPYGNSSGDSKLYDNSKIIEPPYDTDHFTNADVITEIPVSTATTTYSITVQMGRTITHDPNNPYGIDLIVYGNSFFTGAGGGSANDNTNLNAYKIGGVYGHPLIVSVSPDNMNWYTYPEVSDILPIQAYQWNSTTQASTTNLLDFNTPVNPAIAANALANGYTYASQVLDAYGNAAGGTGYDISQSGFSSINYVKVASGTDQYAVVDAIAAVDPVPEPGTLGLIGFGLVNAMLLRRRR